MKGMDNNAPHGFFGGGSDSYGQMMFMGGDGQHGYGGIPSWMEEQLEDFQRQWRVHKQDFQHQ